MTIALVIIPVFLALIYLAVGAYAAWEITKKGPHPRYSDTPATFYLDYQDVRFSARGDDTQIAAWYIPNAESNRAVILVHGRNASKQNAISGEIVALGADIHDAGFVVLIIDTRGHGDSEGERYSFGVYERRDVLGAIDFLLYKGFRPGSIGLLGVSNGGAAAVGAAAEESAIGALVLESTFADINPLIEEQWENETPLPKFFLPGVVLMNKIINGYDLSMIQPIEDIKMFAPRPLLIIHSTSDEIIPMWHPQTFLEAVPYAEAHFFDACDHAEIYRDYPDEYSALVISFFDKNLE